MPSKLCSSSSYSSFGNYAHECKNACIKAADADQSTFNAFQRHHLHDRKLVNEATVPTLMLFFSILLHFPWFEVQMKYGQKIYPAFQTLLVDREKEQSNKANTRKNNTRSSDFCWSRLRFQRLSVTTIRKPGQ